MRKRRTAEHREAICKKRDWRCHLCGLKIDPLHQRYEIDHIIALAAGGSDDDDNLAPAHSKCHLAKTVEDVGKIAKGKRIRAKHLGTKTPSQNPLPGSRRSKWKKTFNRGVVLREPS